MNKKFKMRKIFVKSLSDENFSMTKKGDLRYLFGIISAVATHSVLVQGSGLWHEHQTGGGGVHRAQAYGRRTTLMVQDGAYQTWGQILQYLRLVLWPNKHLKRYKIQILVKYEF